MRPALRVFRHWLLAVALVVCPGAVGAAPRATQATLETPESHHAAGMEHLRAGRVPEALAEFRAALRLDRGYLPSLLQMADLLSSSDRVFEAYGVLQHAVRIAEGSAEAHALLGRCFSRLEKLKEGREQLLRALELKPDLTEPYYGLAAIELRQGRLADARRHVEAFLQRSPDDEAARELLARVCYEIKDYDAALAAYADLHKAHPDARNVQREIGLTLMAAGKYAEAETAFRALVAQDSTDREALRAIYDASYKRGAYLEAIEALEQLARLEPKSCEPLLLLARSYHRLGQLSQARQRAERCLQLEPGHSGAHFLIGWTWFGDGSLAKAKTEFEEALKGDPSSIEALYWLATVELRLGNRAAALPLLEKAVSVDPEYASARYALAQAYAAEGRPDEAKKQFAEFRRLKSREAWKTPAGDEGSRGISRPGPGGPADASHLEDWIGFANYLLAEGRPANALLILEEAKRVAPGNAEVMLLTAAARTETGEIEAALAAYAEAERRGPSGLLYWGRGTLYRRLGEDESALADLRRALSMELPARKAAQAHRTLGSILGERRRWREAEADLRRALALDSTDASARLLLAEALLELGEPAEAAREARRPLDERPGDAAAHLLLARAWLDEKRYDDAAAEIGRASRIEGESARVLLARGRLAVAQGIGKTAIDYLERACQADPSRAEAFHLLGTQLLEGGRPSDAAIAFEKATIVDPTHAASWLGLGRIYLNARRAPAAVNYFQKAVSAAPDNAEAQYQLAVALEQAGRVAEAEEAARQAKALGHPAADSLLQSLAARKQR